ncbi:MAG: restriction endonuclease [Candidatus Hydromicrobium americanum]|nr:MAG: restriction endonuclease [Candidatus Hydromicrobium americanum]
MDKQAAVKIIRDTFEKPFDRGQYVNFIKNLFNSIGDSKNFIYRGNFIPDAFKPYIYTLERIGKYTDAEDNKIDILIAHLKKETSLERARTMQRNFIAWYLSGSRGGDLKDAAIVAFHTDDLEDWRFSLVKMEYKLTQTKSGRPKGKEELTPARRYSFLVGKNEPNHTAKQQLVPLLQDDINNPNLAHLESAFNIEKVTKEFFTKYRELYLELKKSVDEIIKRDKIVQEEFTKKNVGTVDFSKKLLGQIVFLCFLQKKGWLGVQKDKNTGKLNEWGTGLKNFMRKLFDMAKEERANYFNDYLEPLFYEALAIDRGEGAYYSRFDCRIPFLNGGLFEPIQDYDWAQTDIKIPDKLFSNDKKTKEGDIGTGILDVFDRYNFTVKEDEPLDKEVAIDPEMLGKVFENLLEVKDRKSKGSYYTPREIVHYMCQESLINYLATELSSSPLVGEGQGEGDVIANEVKQSNSVHYRHSRSPSCHSRESGNLFVSKEDIETLIHFGDFAIEHDIAKEEGTKSYKYKISECIRENAKLIDDKLANIRICDPAVGSGAFLVGMMTEIVKARNVLNVYICHSRESGNPENKPRTIYHFKRHAIQNCLYGVDIDSSAVDIAKLRLWLSLIVDEEDIKQIKPLPNLDYKIICGNSLLGIERDLLNDYLFKGLEELKLLFFNETNTSKKQELKNEIDKLIKKITNNPARQSLGIGGDEHFDFEIYFSEVFHESLSSQKRGKGFDVVIANPPYVRADSGSEYLEFRRDLEKSGMYKTLYEKWDLIVPFIEKGLQIGSVNGNLNYIVTNSVCTSKYAFKLLDLIQSQYFTNSIDYFEDMSVFEAGVIPVVLHITKNNINKKVKKIVHRSSFENRVNQIEIPIDKFKALGRDAFRKDFEIISFNKNLISLGDICYMSKGMVINADEKKWQGKFTKDDLISDTKTKIHTRKYIEGKDIDEYIIERIRYLEWGTKRVPHQLSRATFLELYDRPKIMRGRVTGGIYDDTGLVCNDSIVIFVKFTDLHSVENKSIRTSVKKFNNLQRLELEKISEKFDLKYLLAILNSSFAFKYLNNIRRHRLENYFYPDDFRKLPIADIAAKDQKPYIDLVDKILAITKDDDYLQNEDKQAKVKEYEHQIDQMVYKLYGLTGDEIKIVEK